MTDQLRKQISELSELERKQLFRLLQIIDWVQTVNEQYKFDQITFCDKFKIKIEEYVDFLNGNFDYSLNHLSTLEYLSEKYKMVIPDHEREETDKKE